MDDRLPETEPSGALVPPPRVPPTAVAAAAPIPLRPSFSSALVRRRGLPALLDAMLDRLDELGDHIAATAGLR